MEFIKKEIYEVGDRVVITDDIDLLSEEYSSAEELAGIVLTISGEYSDFGRILGYLAEEIPYYYFPKRFILGLCPSDYIAPKRPIKKICNYCGCSFKYYDDEDIPQEDKELCPHCRERKMVLPYHRYAPAINFYNTEEENGKDNLYMGLEMEVDEGGELNSNVQKILPIMNDEKNKFFIYCSHDGSLTDGFEIITQPATYNYHKQIMPKYKELFSTLIKLGYQAHNTNTCGIHVHFNRDFYADNESLYISKLLYLVEKFWDDIVIFSRRDKNRIAQYSKKIDTTIPDYIKQWDKTKSHAGHYYAVNLTNENTIEFRIFRGTLNLKSFEAILDFVYACIITAKEKSSQEIQRMKFKELLTPLAKKYYNSRKRTVSYEKE